MTHQEFTIYNQLFSTTRATLECPYITPGMVSADRLNLNSNFEQALYCCILAFWVNRLGWDGQSIARRHLRWLTVIG